MVIEKANVIDFCIEVRPVEMAVQSLKYLQKNIFLNINLYITSIKYEITIHLVNLWELITGNPFTKLIGSG